MSITINKVKENTTHDCNKYFFQPSNGLYKKQICMFTLKTDIVGNISPLDIPISYITGNVEPLERNLD